MAYEELASALENLAGVIARTPCSVTGMSVSVVAGPGSGSVTGMSVSVTAGPGQKGSIVGLNVSVGGGPDPQASIIQELREAAQAVRAATAPKSWLDGLVARVKAIADRAIDATAIAAVERLLSSYTS